MWGAYQGKDGEVRVARAGGVQVAMSAKKKYPKNKVIKKNAADIKKWCK